MMLRSPLSSALVLAFALVLPLVSMAQPANNDCAGAIELFPSSACNAVTGDVAGATQSIAATSCTGINGAADDDVWYRFTATATSHRIEVQGSAQFDAVIDLRSGGCNGTQVRCTDLAPDGVAEWLTPTGLTIGAEYLIRVYSRDATPPATTTFTICVREPVIPANNDCANAIALTPNPTCAPMMGSVANATQSLPAIDCNGVGNANDDVWFSFVATETSHTVEMTVPSGFFPVIDLRSGACNGTNIACNDDVSLVANGLTVGETYYVRLYHIFGSVPSNTSFTVCVIGQAPPQCTADAGTIAPGDTPVCLDGGSATIEATPDGNSVVPVGFQTIYLLAQGAGQVVQAYDAAASFTVTAPDDYSIHTLVYDPGSFDPTTDITSGVTTLADVNGMLLQGGGTICASLDVVGASLTVEVCVVCDADAGTVTADGTPVCLDNGTATISATPDGNSIIPGGYFTVYVLTQGPGLVIVDASATPTFTVSDAADYTIHTLVYDPNTLDIGSIEIGVTTGFDVDATLIQGGGTICASLDLTGAAVTVLDCTCQADASTLDPNRPEVCWQDPDPTTIDAAFPVPPTVPAGFVALHVLTQGAQFIILDTSSTPEFQVSDLGDYIIHTLVYDPLTLDLSGLVLGSTSANDIHAQLIQGGGSICGSLDLAGAAISVVDCPECPIDAGSLSSVADPVCLDNGSATISATPDGNMVGMAGIDTLYVLTLASDLTILDASATPSFTVTSADDYLIHTLLYDPLTLDLGSIVFGTTTGYEVAELFIENGGVLCGDLDVVGAPITVEECLTCDAIAGALIADSSPVCIITGAVNISATPDGGAVVPAGYEVIYVLTQGANLVLQAVDASPLFTVNAADSYTIHTLVYDPNTLDLGSLVLGTTTAFEVEALLLQGGGSICAALDVTGALIVVVDCPPCDANAGTLTADETPVCLFGGTAQIGATPNGDAVVPSGYETVYVLTVGPDLLIVGASAGPVFTVAAQDSYTIHTLVYDPLTIDPGAIELGVTTGFDINALLIQGGSTICGSLDLVGATILVNDCAPGNNNCVNAFPLAVNLEADCPAQATNGTNVYATMDGVDASCDAPGANLLDVWYTFNSGANTSVTLNFDPGTMEDWAISILDGCAGTELLCFVQPIAPIDLVTDPGTDYVVRIHSNLANGNGGEFTICITGDVPTTICDGGSVQTVDGFFSVDVCMDAVPDVIDFATTSTAAENYTFLLTDDSNIIVAQLVGGSLDFNSATLGTYHVWGISHNGDLVGADPGSLATAVTSTGTCIDFSDNFVVVNVEICDGLADAGAAVWSLFPNPGNGDFTLTYAGPGAMTTLEVVDMEGRIAHRQSAVMTNGQPLAVELNGKLAMGVYTVRLFSTAGSHTTRLVVR